MHADTLLTMPFSQFSKNSRSFLKTLDNAISIVGPIKIGLFMAQGAGRPFDLLKRFPIYGTFVFLWEMTWGSMFTKVILLQMVESIYCF